MDQPTEKPITSRHQSIMAIGSVSLGVMFIAGFVLLATIRANYVEISKLTAWLIFAGASAVPLVGLLMGLLALRPVGRAIAITGIILNGVEIVSITMASLFAMVTHVSARSIPSVLLLFFVASVSSMLVRRFWVVRRDAVETFPSSGDEVHAIPGGFSGGEAVPVNAAEAAMVQVSAEDSSGRKLYLWVEVGVVLLVCVVPVLFNSIANLYLIGRSGNSTFLYSSLATIVRSTADVALVLFIIWKSKEPLAHFGLRRLQAFADIFEGIGIWAAGWLCFRIAWMVLPNLIGLEKYKYALQGQVHIHYATPSSGYGYVLLAVMCLANGSAEELVIRAYLIPRLEELLGSTVLALTVSTVIFAGNHVYQGSFGFIDQLIFGLVQGVAFCMFRRFAPIALAHAFADFIGIMGRT